jgi:glycerol-3-phosphate dehydrogenase
MFCSKYRSAYLQQITSSSTDLLVIGGGITGAGIALDACTRGLRTALVEMQDFAAGTSGRSTKLVHGGLRYLKQLEFGLVREVGRERAIVHRNAPHLTHPEPMLLPIIRNGSMSKTAVRIGMWIYESLAGVRKNEWHTVLDASQTRLAEPLLDKAKVLGAVKFYEYRTDDARLTIEVIKEAVSRGATAINYMKVTGFLYENDRLSGVILEDQLTGEVHEARAGKIVNAAGPWVDVLDRLDNPSAPNHLVTTKGIHVVVDRKIFPVRHSLYFDTPDKRMIFAIPREGKVYIGTTDTFYTGSLEDPDISRNDCQYLLNSVSSLFPDVPLKMTDIESSWAGLRPLVQKGGKDPSEISRKDEMFISGSGLITIAGGKLTGYRKMSERVVDLVFRKLKKETGRAFTSCSTDKIPISGGNTGEQSWEQFRKEQTEKAKAMGIPAEETAFLLTRYGSNITRLFRMYEEGEAEAARYKLPGLLFAELKYSLEEEMVTKPADFFIRRTGSLYFNIDGVQKWKEAVSAYISAYFGWSSSRHALYLGELEGELRKASLQVSSGSGI